MVCLDKITCVKMHDLIVAKWQEKAAQLKRRWRPKKLVRRQGQSTDRTPQAAARAGGVDEGHRVLCGGITGAGRGGRSLPSGRISAMSRWTSRRTAKDGQTRPGKEFKKADNPFRIAIVCAMWLTGFDVKCLATLYLDKPMQGHTLMQAIARVNRVGGGKKHGPIIDYNGMIKSLRRALATLPRVIGWHRQGEGRTGYRRGTMRRL